MVPYERFDAWKMTHQLALQVYEVTESWPLSERYGLTIQIRRAALSAPTNIAEGSAKRGPASFGATWISLWVHYPKSPTC